MDTHTLTEQTLASFDLGDDRRNQLLAALIRHLHGFACEVRLTHEEWRKGLRFLTAAGAITDERRNEFSLLSDVLGLSSLIDLLHYDGASGATPGSVLGPFHVAGARWQDNGTDLQAGQAGEPTLFSAQVLSADGTPVQATVEFWQNADNGLYPQQDSLQPEDNLRCQVRTGTDGCFALRTVLPRPYGIPDDGPGGDLMRLAGRSCMRPAHFHLIVHAEGHKSLVTEIFLHGDTYLDSDAVFGVRDALVVRPELVKDPASIARHGMPGPFHKVRCGLRLARTGGLASAAGATL